MYLPGKKSLFTNAMIGFAETIRIGSLNAAYVYPLSCDCE